MPMDLVSLKLAYIHSTVLSSVLHAVLPLMGIFGSGYGHVGL